jgi:lysophospholipase L1-like esterase
MAATAAVNGDRDALRHRIATIALGPILLLQGRRVRRTVPLLPEPEGPREGVCGSGAPLRLLVLGDSAAAGVGALNQAGALTGQLADALGGSFQVRWKLIAQTGATTQAALDHLQKIEGQAFDVVVTSLGVNDVTAGCSLDRWRRVQGELVALLRSKFRTQHVLLSGLPPMHKFPALPQPLRWYLGSRARQFDRVLEALANTIPGCEFVKLAYTMDTQFMAVDGFHPGPAIYAMWGADIARRIRARWPVAKPSGDRTLADSPTKNVDADT